MKNVFNKNILKKIIVIFILLQPILDTYILFEQDVIDIFKFSPSTIIRLFFVFVIAIFSILVLKFNKEWKYFIVYIFLLILYTLFHLYSVSYFKTLSPDNFNYSKFSELFYIIRLLIPIFLIIVCSKIKFTKKEIKKIFYILFFMISGTIVITNIFKISTGAYVTKTINYNIIEWFTKNIHASYSFYDTATRGYFSFANMISSLLFGFTGILFYNLYKNCNFKNMFFLVIQMLAMFMLGTKIATFGYILSLVAMFMVYIYFCMKKDIKLKRRNIIITILLICLWISIYPYSPCKNRMFSVSDNTLNNDEKIDDDIKEIKDNIEDDPEQIKEFLKDNYEKFSIKEDYIIDYYPYQYDYIFWYNMLSESYTVKSDNRLLMINILNRMKDVDNRKVLDELFGVSYSRMSNIAVLERDFVSQYYSLGIIGLIILVMPLAIIPLCCFIRILKNKNLNFYNTALVVSLFSSLVGAYYCGNTLDNLTFSIIYAFFCGVLVNEVYSKKERELKENKITILALHLGYGGVEQYISSLCKMLDNDYEIEIVSTYKVLEKPAFFFDNKIKITYLINDKPNKEEFKQELRNKNIINILKEGFKSIKLLYLKRTRNIKAIKDIDSKYIITTRSFHNKLVSNYAYCDIIKIATEHNYHNNDNKYINSLINSIKKYDYLVVVSNSLKEFYEDKIGNTKCIYIPNVIDELPDKSTNLKNNNIINVGRIEKEKDQISLIETFKKVKEKVRDAKLYIIGDGSLRSTLNDKIKEYNLSESVFLTGFLSKKEIENYMINSKLFVLTSLTESFGLVLIEAMSYKVPCIAFDTSDGARNLLSNGNGILIKNRDIDKMSNEIIKLLNDDTKLKKISNKGYESCKKYLLVNVKEEWLKLLNK